jgi:hypothetical protein
MVSFWQNFLIFKSTEIKKVMLTDEIPIAFRDCAQGWCLAFNRYLYDLCFFNFQDPHWASFIVRPVTPPCFFDDSETKIFY